MTLPWFKLYVDIFDHPKSDELADELGVDDAWRYVVRLMGAIGKYQPTGDLSGWSDRVLATKAGWRDDPQTFVAALVQTGWLDADRTFHDWWKVQGAHVRKALKDKGKRIAPEKPPKNPRGTPAEPPKNPRARGEERRGEEIPPTGVQGGSRGSPRPKPPDLPDLLAEHETKWRAEFPALDGEGGRPDLTDVAQDAWDHKARKKRTDMPRYLTGWLRKEHEFWRTRGDKAAKVGGWSDALLD